MRRPDPAFLLSVLLAATCVTLGVVLAMIAERLV